MNKNIIKLSLAIIYLLFCAQCSSSTSPAGNEDGGAGSENLNSIYDWEKARKDIVQVDDLVLIYGGGAHRTNASSMPLDPEHMTPYITYEDKAQNKHWLFDGFLFLEIHNGKGKEFATGYTGDPATKAEWTELIDFYFTSNNAICAIEKAIEKAKANLAPLPNKRKIVIGIPEPKAGQTNWGDVNGRTLNFADDRDRVAACKWYIDYARESFNKGKFKHVELVGFYWIAEHSADTKDILSDVSLYLNRLNYSFNWIPYFNAVGYKDWRKHGFNYSYHQPNHYFNDDIPYSRLNDACRMAKECGMGMEVEFDESALVRSGDRSSRLRDYMKAFRENEVLTSPIAYYQGGSAVYQLSVSDNAKDKELYHDFCAFVLDHAILIGQEDSH